MAVVAVASVLFDSDLLAVGLCATILALLIVGRVFGHHEASLCLRHVRDFRVAFLGVSRFLFSRETVAGASNSESG